ncbi:MAG: amidohydrolase family protein [Planctomycetota bacterium]
MKAFNLSIAGRTRAGLAFLLIAFVGAPALGSPAALGAVTPFDDDDATEESTDDEEEEQWLALVGGDVHLGTGGVLRGATVLTHEGKIAEVGYDVFVPEEAEVVDVAGMRVYPGLIAVGSFGLFGGSGNLRDSVDPYSRNMTLALAAGITTAVNGNTVAKLKRGHLEGLVLKDSAFENFSFSNRNPQGQLKVVSDFEKAAEYLRQYRAWEQAVKRDKELKAPSKKGIDDRTVRVLTGEIRPRFSANDRTDLAEIAALARRFGFRPILEGATEGWTVADELGRAGATAIVTPRRRSSASERQTSDNGSSIENAAKLHAHGVPVVVVPASRGIVLGGIVGQDLLHLPIEAGFAIRGGLPEQAALESITIEAARVLGVGHRIGSIEVGKDADLIVTDGDLLHYQTFVQWAIVDGEIVYDKQEEMFFAHIRPRPDSALAPEEKVDAGEEDAADPQSDEGDAGDEGDSGDEEAGDGDGSGDEPEPEPDGGDGDGL